MRWRTLAGISPTGMTSNRVKYFPIGWASLRWTNPQRCFRHQSLPRPLTEMGGIKLSCSPPTYRSALQAINRASPITYTAASASLPTGAVSPLTPDDKQAADQLRNRRPPI